MKKDKSLMHMKNAIEKQVPDVWEKIKINIENEERADLKEIVIPTNNRTLKKSSVFYKRLSIVSSGGLFHLSNNLNIYSSLGIYSTNV
ncbi:hypothetical protein CN514_09275 [Bacillus sp. AFS001701]|uniref:hypothetical protein n=1 Tax=Bacillus sp. AFS001701 TaxID=2033480 RepID=UPI000BF785E6|nr:hypothetical protein [Bacillus sp. AFS001701]PET68900.1 hypothetical protein CN514_09275 [Bacillus sp. AFS001701]